MSAWAKSKARISQANVLESSRSTRAARPDNDSVAKGKAVDVKKLKSIKRSDATTCVERKQNKSKIERYLVQSP